MKVVKELTSTPNTNARESEVVCQTQEEIKEGRSELYEASTYTLIECKEKKGETLFSFEMSS